MLGDPKKKELKELKKKGLDRSFADITAPLVKMVDDLETYAAAQAVNEADLEVEKAAIQAKINVSKDEQDSSKSFASKLKDLKDPNKKLMFEEAGKDEK